MLLLPKPYPGEVVGSILLRGRRNYGLPLKPFLSWIHGAHTRRSTASFVMETNVPLVAQLCGLKPRQFLYEHTVFPYVVAYLPWDYVSRLESRFLDTQLPVTPCTASLLLNVTQGAPYRKYCPQCSKSDERTYGETYWHTVHQLPTALICLIHRTPLAVTSIKAGITSTRDSLSLPPVSAPRPTPPLVDTATATTLTELSAGVLNLQDDLRANWCDRYRTTVRHQGFVFSNGVMASSILAASLRAHFGDKFLAKLKCELNLPRQTAWPALLLRPGEKEPTSVVRHLLMETFLVHGEIGALQQKALKARTYKTRDYAQIDRVAAKVLKRTISEACERGELLTVHQLLDAAGIRAPYVHARDRFPQCRRIVDEFRASPQAARRLGGSEYWRKRTPSRWSDSSKHSAT